MDQKGSRGDNGGDKPKSRGRKGKNKKRGKKQMNDPTRGAEGIRKSMVRIFLFCSPNALGRNRLTGTITSPVIYASMILQ